MRISDWSSDVCSSDLGHVRGRYILDPFGSLTGSQNFCRHSGWILPRYRADPSAKRGSKTQPLPECVVEIANQPEKLPTNVVADSSLGGMKSERGFGWGTRIRT